MEQNKGYLEKILSYEADEMDANEQQAFNNDLVEDNDFKAFYEHWQASKSVQEILAYDEIRSRIKTIASEKPTVRLSFRRYLSVAAAALLLITAATLLLINHHYSNHSIAQTYYQLPNFSMNRAVPTTTIIEKAKIAFGQQHYSQCVTLLNATTNHQEQYLLAHALYANKSYEKAAKLFGSLAQSGDERVSIDAEWYQALVLLDNGKTNVAIPLLTAIAQNDHHSYQDDALAVLTKLDSYWRNALVF